MAGFERNQFVTKLPRRASDSKISPARFVLLLKSIKDRSAVEAALRREFAQWPIDVAPFSASDRLLLKLTFTHRLMPPDIPTAFDLTYQLIDHFHLENAEPEIFTDLLPERSAEPTPKAGQEESVDDLIPGCWVESDPDIDEDTKWAISTIRVPEAWQASTNSGLASQGETSIIAHIDTGLTNHPELAGVSLLPGYDFLREQPTFEDPMNYDGNPGHGTATASVIVSGAFGKVAGAAPRVDLMPLRAIESVVRISQVAVAEAIDHAIAHGAHIITMSLGGLPSMSLRRALDRAVSADLIVLAAAGNCVGFVVFPARYEACLAIGATNRDNTPWKGSSFGPDIDVSAPGENVYTARTERNGSDGSLIFSSAQSQGTSFAVALTAGAAALWLAHHGRDRLIARARQNNESLQTMFGRLVRATSTRPSADWDTDKMGAGIVNAFDLVSAALNLGLDLEGPRLVDAGRTSEAVKSLVMEATGSAAAAQSEIDWERFGPEIAHMLLKRQRLIGQTAARHGAVEEGAAVDVTPLSVSRQLQTVLDRSLPLAEALDCRRATY